MPGHAQETIASAFVVKIGGSELKDKTDLLEVIVDTSIHMPNMCVIHIHDTNTDLIDSASMDIGKTIEITANDELLFKGEITALEPIFSDKGKATMVIRGYDKSHRLFLTKKTLSHIQRKDSEIVKLIDSNADVDATSVIYPYLFQNNQTDWEFLAERAARIGYILYTLADGKLCFKKGMASQGDGPEIKWGEELLEFRPRLSTAHQVEKVTVWGWDSDKQKAIKVEKPAVAPSFQGGVSQSGGATAKSKFSGGETHVVTLPVLDDKEAAAMAEGLAAEINSGFLQGEGVCVGNALIRAGKSVTIKEAGTRFSGKYFISSARHVYRGKYRTYIEFHGQQPHTVYHLLQGRNGGGHQDSVWSAMPGLVIGTVSNLNDPFNIGRVKVKFNWLGEAIESNWARIASPMAGNGMGLYWLPEMLDEVLIGFEHGDITRPYILGTLWNKKHLPPKKSSEVVVDGKVNQRIIKSRSGHLIILDDTKDAEKIIIQDKTGKNEMIIDSKNNAISITVEDKLTITAKGEINIKSSNADMTLEAQNINLKAKSDCSIEGANCSMMAKSMCTVEGKTQVEVKAAGVGNIVVSSASVNVNKGALEVT